MKNNHILYSVFLVWICVTALSADNYVIINQVMYDTPLNEIPSISPCSNGEYIELYNAGTDTVSLQGWHLYGGGNSEIVSFADTLRIPAGNYLIIACKRGQSNTFLLDSLYTMPVTTNYTVLYQNKIMLANDGERLTLCNAQNDTIDQMHYDGTSHLSNPHRLYASNPDSIPGDFCVSLHRTEVEFDAQGKVLSDASRWTSSLVTFAETKLPHASYYENHILGGQSLPLGENYILSITPLDPTMRIDMNDGNPSISGDIRMRTDLQYFDGLGRTDEIIAIGVTPNQKDLVSTLDYCGKQKVSRQWLPIEMQTEGQRLPIADVQTQARTDYADDYPFSETQYENSARRNILTQTRPGAVYAPHKAQQTYSLNSAADQIRIYTVSEDSSLHTVGTYAASTLYKTTASDEDDKSVTTYIDKQGRKIMEERNGNRTYYVYDELGRLRYILPNWVSSAEHLSLDNSTLKASAYCYNYDNRGNMTYKRIPGAEEQYMVYDRMGQLVLKQDGNQRTSGKWTMCAYDTIGRCVYTAEIGLTAGHQELIALFADKWQVEHYGLNRINIIPNTGYASTILGTTNLRLLTVNYYDTYNYLYKLQQTVHSALEFRKESGYDARYENATGMLTGTRIYNLSENGFCSIAYYYDAKGQIIQSRSTRRTEGYSITNTQYLFDGSIAQQLIIQDTVREHYQYTYDHAGRAKKVTYKLNNDAEITLSEFSYDSIGRMAQNLLYHNDTIMYSYDIRNMQTEAHNKHFSERLYYAENLPETAQACYNGNISAASVARQDTAFTFTYLYDQLNRLTSANLLTDYSSVFSEQLTYDPAGNILSLKRYNDYRKIDDLNYSYGNEGNQLWSITDNSQDADKYDVIEYHNGAMQADTTMRYDANGNLVYDADRGISIIHYNMLNLPDTIQFISGHQIVNLYDAIGRKYKSITYTNIASAIQPCYEIAHYTCTTDSVEYHIVTYEGTIENHYTKRDTTYRLHNTIGYYTDSIYYHYIKDHLGNICAVVNSSADTVVQSTLFYASGVPMAQSFGRDKQSYLYNGKEFIEAHGLNTYDYGFRGYYAPIGRFTTIDPLAEQTPWQSPYSYANNNFTNAIDWMGLSGLTGYTSTYNWTAVNDQGIVVGVDMSSSDLGVYLVDGEWDGTYAGLDNYPLIGWQIPGIRYRKGGIYDFILGGCGGIFSAEYKSAVPSWGYTYQFGFAKDNSNNALSVLSDLADFSALTIGLGSDLKCNSLWWIGKNGELYFDYQRHLPGGYARSYKIAEKAIRPLKTLSNKIIIAGLGLEIMEILTEGEIKPSNGINIFLGLIAPTGIGAIIGGVYFLVDSSILIMTGSALGEKLDMRYGGLSLGY